MTHPPYTHSICPQILSACVNLNSSHFWFLVKSLSFTLFRKYLEVEKDSEEDNEWEKLFDKRTGCVFLLNGVQSYSETIRCKIFKVQDIELL